jgi:hypothetical protein
VRSISGTQRARSRKTADTDTSLYATAGPRPDPVPTSAKTLCKTKRRFGNVQQDSSVRRFTESRVGGDRAGATFRWPHFLATFHSAPHLRLSHGPAAVSSAARSGVVWRALAVMVDGLS